MRPTRFVSAAHCAVVLDARIPPALEVEPGEVVTSETGDEAYRRLATGESVEEIGLERFNTVTGPVLVRGAEPGDALRVEVLEIAIERAWIAWLPGFGPFGARLRGLQTREVLVSGGRVHLSERLRVPLEPMVGCIGLAPAVGQSSTLGPAFPWGGNFDLRELSPGATILLPVQVPGALLSLGDLHAAMGRAEPALVAIEAAGRATVRIDLEKSRWLQYPRLLWDGATGCLGLGETLAAAQRCALDQAYALLVGEWGLDTSEAYAYLCARVQLRPGGPASPMVLAVVPDPLLGDH
jgi:amidase